VIAFATAGAGFLLAVLWFDLMFDVQILGHRENELPEKTLSSIATYYRRVTTAARPMNKLIAVVMLATIAAIVLEILDGGISSWAAWVSLLLACAPILLAGGHTVPSAVRLGTRADSIEAQSALARSICREHLLCLASIAALLVLQLSCT
jgi:Ca2+/Na+ antiporter